MVSEYVDSYQVLFNHIAQFHEQYARFIDLWFLVFARMLAFSMAAPLIGRQDIPFNIKIGFAMVMATVMLWTLPHVPDKAIGIASAHADASANVWPYIMLLGINGVIGVMIGFIANTIIMTVNASGSIVTNQIGLSSAMVFDPSTKQQVTIIEKFVGFLVVIIFYHLGGMYWLIQAVHRSFEIFPVYVIQPDIMGQINIDYLIKISGNTLEMAVQLVAPVMLMTIVIDLVLGIVNRTAQQIQVFQLSFGLKPSIGVATMLITLPFFIKEIQQYLQDFSRIF